MWNKKIKNNMPKPLRVILSAGGTGGHIFPAIAIANHIKQTHPQAEILFIGASGRMEMEKVPAAGYHIIGLPIAGFQRKWKTDNLFLPFKIIISLIKAFIVITRFKPDIVIGFGGYASAPVLYISALLGKPAVIQEQNSYAGVTNKILSKRCKAICVAYENMDKFFPKEKLHYTGNPVRKDLINIRASREEAAKFFGLQPNKKTILVIGGSLGSLTLNESAKYALAELKRQDIQMIWQTGKAYFSKAKIATADCSEKIKVFDFLNRMDLAYTLADLVISRAGALSIAELAVLGKPVILVPSPNVAEDHQTKNAMALVNKNAAILVRDADARENLFETAMALLSDENKLQQLRNNILSLAITDADKRITEVAFKFLKRELA
jgi:UDP-N-acetylglucosamine--N-acetylmuramyl-(pentapeptide) pyrophosphoryl-undecaprenol N-acetylglucosamine transferase